jgi:DNA polymerase
MTLQTLSIDIETYSSYDLKTSGVYRYVEAPDFQVLLFGYAFDEDLIQVVDLTREKLPNDVYEALTDPKVIKTAHNATFERVCLGKYLKRQLPVEQWQCTMTKAAMLGLPLSLEACGKPLHLETQKSLAGKQLIKYFSVPCKPTKVNQGRTRNLPNDDFEKWKEFIEYNRTDVDVERQIRQKLAFFEVPEVEREIYCLDQVINDRGVQIDRDFVERAIDLDTINRFRLLEEATRLTGLVNPNSAAQLKAWLTDEGLEVDNLQKGTIPELLEQSPSHEITRVLTLRQQLSKSSIRKYSAMLESVCADGRLRGLVQYYGAGRTGRWAGRLVQVHNLTRNTMSDLDLARECVATSGDLELLYDNVAQVLSELIRTSFVPAAGHRFIVSDFSAIEARITAWLAQEQWRLDVFRGDGKIYEASAAHMFKVPLSKVTKDSVYRTRGKVAELACGFGGGVGALRRMGGLDDLSDDELQEIIDLWRRESPKIVQLWYDVQACAIKAIQGTPMRLAGLRFFKQKGLLFIQLPSGRQLCYVKPELIQGPYGLEIHYLGLDQTTQQWCRQHTYGGKLVENIVQAIARDCLAHKMLSLEKARYRVVMHVHDEVVLEVQQGSVEEVNKLMSAPLKWAKDLPLSAESFETNYYKK